jgi:hypothetical protein
MARKNTPATYACGNCNEHGHNRRTCPALGLVAKVKPVKKPRAKKVVEETATAPAIPFATEEQMEDLRTLVAQIAAEVEAETAREEEVSEVEEEIEPTDAELAEIEAGDVDAAFEAEEEVFDASDVSDEEASAFLDEYAALFA